MSGKTIYAPKGAAGEYARFACNFFTGCGNGCTYCYLKRFPLLAGGTPVLSARYADEEDALRRFRHELRNRDGSVREDLKEHGILFTFTSDPMLPGSLPLNTAAMLAAMDAGVPVSILTKLCGWMDTAEGKALLEHPAAHDLLAVGFTVTGHNEMEPKADANDARVHTLRRLHLKGYRTFASVEPVFDFDTALSAVRMCASWADVVKIGLKSGTKRPSVDTLGFVRKAAEAVDGTRTKVLFKDSVLRCLKEPVPEHPNIAGKDYNIFIEKREA